MARVTIEFHGVCVHVRRATGSKLPAGVDHRVVLIDGRHGRNENGQAITPHVPKVDVYDERPDESMLPRASFVLSGQHLWIAGGTDGLPVAQDGFSCAVPPLRDFIPSLSVDSRVVVDGDQVAGFVDLAGGTIGAEFRHTCAGVAIFESPVSDGATLEIRGIRESLSGSVALSSDAWIIVSNVGGTLGGNADGRDADDRNVDFLLNYLISGAIPAGAPILDKCRPCLTVVSSRVFPLYSIGPGCSNTQYP